jgi:hypothetical protein
MPHISLWFPADWTREETRAFAAQVAEVAASHGYRNHFGQLAGRGNIVAMLRAIESGELATVMLADEQRDYAIRRLRELAPEQDGITAEAFLSLAGQLDYARQRERQR